MIHKIFLIAFGGAFGAVLRFLFVDIITKYSKYFHIYIGKFPLGTFSVNVIGSALAGVFYFLIIKNFNSNSIFLKNFIMIGALGSFTTFSAFSLDFFRLFNSTNYFLAFSYCFLSIFFSILSLFFGYYVTNLIVN
jgi:CrcB protein